MQNGENVEIAGKIQSSYASILYQSGKLFLNLRWYVIIGLGVFVLVFEGFEVLGDAATPPFSDPHINAELMLYLAIIFIVALLAEVYVRLLKSHAQALKLLNIKHDLSQHLTKSKDWNEVCNSICQKIGEIGPFAEVTLLTFDSEQASHQIAASWTPHRWAKETVNQPASFPVKNCIHRDTDPVRDVEDCTCIPSLRLSTVAGGFCFPIYDQHQPIARLFIQLRSGEKLSKEMKELLNSIRDEISTALKTTWLRKVQAEMRVENATSELRRVISQDLHDTIGQNLCFMHMRLDYYAQPETKEDPAKVKRELATMRELANESYELVRGLLVTMRPQPVMFLEDLLRFHARLVSDRTGLDVQVIEHGQRHKLDPTCVHHIYFIFREALYNIEKHAQARKVIVDVNWGEKELLLEIWDNGKGFDPNLKPGIGHHGISIMHDRAQKLGGHLDFLSSSGKGTHVSLQLPFAAPV